MKKYKLFLFAAALVLALGACKYTFIEEAELPPVDGGGNGEETVSFATDVLPILTANCATCHATRNPVLTSSEAYKSLATSKYVNVTTPSQSYLIQHVGPSSTAHTQKHFTTAQATVVLTWIAEGAKNN